MDESTRAGHMKIYAAQVSTYGRIAATVAEEAGLSHETVPTDARSDAHRARHPFNRAPAVEIGGLVLYETAAICQYIDDVYNGSGLQPRDPEPRARMTQWIGIADAYLFPVTEERLVMPRIVVPMMGRVAREDLIAEALPTIRYYLGVVEERLATHAYLAGPDYSLADIFVYCILRAVSLTPEGAAMLADLPATARWLAACAARPAIAATAWPLETGARVPLR